MCIWKYSWQTLKIEFNDSLFRCIITWFGIKCWTAEPGMLVSFAGGLSWLHQERALKWRKQKGCCCCYNAAGIYMILFIHILVWWWSRHIESYMIRTRQYHGCSPALQCPLWNKLQATECFINLSWVCTVTGISKLPLEIRYSLCMLPFSFFSHEFLKFYPKCHRMVGTKWPSTASPSCIMKIAHIKGVFVN